MQPAIAKEEIEIALTKFFHTLIQHTFQKRYGLGWFKDELMPQMISCAENNETETDKKYSVFLANKGNNAKLSDMDVTVCANVLLFDEKYQHELSLDNSQKQALHELRADKNKLVSHSGILTDSTRLALFSRVISDLQMAAELFNLASIDEQLAVEIEGLQRSLFCTSSDSTSNSTSNSNDETDNPFAQQFMEGERMLAQGNLKDAFGIHQELAELGFDLSMIRLAEFHIKGTGTQINMGEAEKWLLAAADSGNGDAAVLLEKLLEFIGLEEEARQGSSAAMVKLGVFYETGDLVEQDAGRAMDYYVQAAEKGSFLAKKRIEALAAGGEVQAFHVMYPKLKGTASLEEKQRLILQALAQSADTQQRREIISLIADEGDLMFQTARTLYQNSASPDSLECCRLLAEAGEEAGHPELTNLLGLMYRDGNGVDQNINKAGKLFDKAMELGSSNAFVNLLPLAYQLTEGLDIRRLRETYHFYENLKKQRINMPLPLLEKLHRYTVCVEGRLLPNLWDKNSRKEAEAFLEAAKLGVESAYLAVAKCFDFGHGETEIDKGQALKWYKKSKSPEAASYIAAIYDADGPYQDKEQALYWYEKYGSGYSYMRMGCIYNEEGKYHNSRRAFECFKKAAEKDAAYHGHLGLCYYYGKGTDLSMELAAQCFKKVEGEIMFRTGFGTIEYMEEDHTYYQFFNEYKLIAYELGLMYRDGIELKRLDSYAFRAFQAAAYKTDNAAALFECARYAMKDNITYTAGKNSVALSRFILDENGFPSCGRGHFTGEEMLVTSAEAGYQPAISHALQLYNEGKLKLTNEKAAELREMLIKHI